MRTVAVAARGKGRLNVLRRAGAIGSRYGLGPGRMKQRLSTVLRLTERFNCSATLPVTAAAFERHPDVIARYSELGIEFAVHGYRHIDHAGLPATEQIEQLGRARRLLQTRGLPVTGFRAPYLRFNEATMPALRENGYLYDSSQAMNWPLDPDLETDAYGRVLTFYDALPAAAYPVLPRLEDGLVRIPVTLPDDESLLDRLHIDRPETIGEIWLEVLRQTVERGELFTMQVHPERVEPCAHGISVVLEAARAAQPGVWIARLDEIARWWKERASARVDIRTEGDRLSVSVSVAGPRGVGVLARNIAVPGGLPWSDGYVLAPGTELTVPGSPRPFIGVHPSSAATLLDFLRQQGYLAETATSDAQHPCFLRRERFAPEDELPLLLELEAGAFPLVRLTRWPGGARAALAVTGDVDALTLWDYAFRFLGR